MVHLRRNIKIMVFGMTDQDISEKKAYKVIGTSSFISHKDGVEKEIDQFLIVNDKGAVRGVFSSKFRVVDID